MQIQASACFLQARLFFREELSIEEEESKSELGRHYEQKEPEKDESIAQLLKEMRDDIKDIKSDLKDNKKNMLEMSQKIDSMERKQKGNETKTVAKLEELRNEMVSNNTTMQETIRNEMVENNTTMKETIQPK